MLLINASNDDYETLRLFYPTGDADKAVEIAHGGVRPCGGNLQRDGQDLILRGGLARMEVKAIVLS
jgi:hypothetical protein